MIIKYCMTQKKYLLLLFCCFIAETADGMLPQYHDTQPKHAVMPLVIGTTCILGVAGLYYFYRPAKKDAAIANPDKRNNNQVPQINPDDQKISADGAKTYTFEIKYEDKNKVKRKKIYSLPLTSIVEGTFKRFNTDETFRVDAVNNNPELTFQLLEKLFAEGGDHATKSTLKDSKEYCFFIKRMHSFEASDEVKKKVALKYCFPKIKEILSRTCLRDKLTKQATIEMKQATVEMVPYLPDEEKIYLENELYGLRFKTKKFQALCSTVNDINKQITSLLNVMHENTQQCGGYEPCEERNNAIHSFDFAELRAQLPILSRYDSFKTWYNSFKCKLYRELYLFQITTILACHEFTNIKQKYPLTFSGKTSNEQSKGNIFTCAKCETKYTLPSAKISIDTQNTIACKTCVKGELMGRSVNLYDCYNLDCVSLCRLIHKAYNYSGFWNRITEEDSEAYEDIPHGNRLHLPLLQLLLKYYGIGYYEGDGAHGCRAYLKLGLYPVLLDKVDIETLPTLRNGDREEYNCIECIIHHKNEINELLTLTEKTLPSIPAVVTITYIKDDTYHLSGCRPQPPSWHWRTLRYECLPHKNKITLDLTAWRTKLALYFHTGSNYPYRGKKTQKEMETEDSTIPKSIKQLKNLAGLYNLDYEELKTGWVEWWEDNKKEKPHPHDYATITITLPIKHEPIKK